MGDLPRSVTLRAYAVDVSSCYGYYYCCCVIIPASLGTGADWSRAALNWFLERGNFACPISVLILLPVLESLLVRV